MAYTSRPSIPKRKAAPDSTGEKSFVPVDFPKQFGKDVTRGYEEAKHLVTTAVERVKEGFRKVKKHLGGK